MKPEFNIIPSKRQFIIDDYLCIRCKKCMKQCPVGAIHVEDDGKVVVNPFKCISCGECLDVCPVNGAMKGVFVDNIQDQKELIAQVVTFLEKYINNKEEDLRALKKDRLLQYNFPLSDILDKALEIISDEEIALEILTNAINRLKIRIIDWDSETCKKCQMCIPDCPTKAISFDEKNDTIVRNENKCLRCSICYQSCPFSTIKYFISKFSLEEDENGEKIVNVTVKASNLNEEVVMG